MRWRESDELPAGFELFVVSETVDETVRRQLEEKADNLAEIIRRRQNCTNEEI